MSVSRPLLISSRECDRRICEKDPAAARGVPAAQVGNRGNGCHCARPGLEKEARGNDYRSKTFCRASLGNQSHSVERASSREASLARRRATALTERRQPESEAPRALRLLRDNREPSSAGDPAARGVAAVAVLARLPLVGRSVLVGALRAAAPAFPPTAARGGPLGVPFRSEAVTGGAGCLDGARTDLREPWGAIPRAGSFGPLVVDCRAVRAVVRGRLPRSRSRGNP